MKRVVRLVQTYLSVKSVELELRPFAEGDASTDARGLPLAASAVPSIHVSSPLSAAAAAVKEDDADKDNDDVEVDDNTTKRKSRKKRRNSRKSEEIDEQATTKPVDRGFYDVTLII